MKVVQSCSLSSVVETDLQHSLRSRSALASSSKAFAVIVRLAQSDKHAVLDSGKLAVLIYAITPDFVLFRALTVPSLQDALPAKL